jgi:perosamine synthetase
MRRWSPPSGGSSLNFEKQIAEISSTPDAVAVAAGTMGLHIALVSLGVGPDDLVILPSFTFIASANAVSHSGAKPWLMDIDPSSWTLDPAVVLKELEDNTTRRGDDLIHVPSGKRVAAIMPVYTLGTPADMDALGSIAKEFRLPIVADAAAALGALYKGKPIAQFADLTVYSFNGNKTITTGGGGGVAGHDSDAMSRIRHLTTTARSTADYDHDLVGFNYRMTNLEAAVGCAQALKLERFIDAKKAIRQAYDAAFRDTPDCDPFPDPEWGSSVYWFSGIVMRPDSVMSAREVVRRLNTDFRIGARTFWKPVHLQQPYADAPRSSMDQFRANLGPRRDPSLFNQSEL